jgi:uncharacterized protein (DUF1810 family)
LRKQKWHAIPAACFAINHEGFCFIVWWFATGTRFLPKAMQYFTLHIHYAGMTLMVDTHHLARFVEAQHSCFSMVEKELAAGRKRSHWMWFIFPQLTGLGQSATSIRYAIRGIQEAQAYVNHEVLGARLKRCTELVCQHVDKSAFEIFGSPDDLKFKSSMTLFSMASPQDEIFSQALQIFFAGAKCQRTVAALESV